MGSANVNLYAGVGMLVFGERDAVAGPAREPD